MAPLLRFTRDISPNLAGRSDALTELSIGELQGRLRRRELKPSELTEAHLARIAAVNPVLNAVIGDRSAAAQAEARLADAVLARTPDAELHKLPALFAIPCTVKEFFGVAGQPHTGGMMRRAGNRAGSDCTVVERLRQAGAIVLGVTNVPEGGLWMETHNLIYGRTRNPWNLAHTSGGSSGGEGAIVAAGGAPFGIGSDVGGSIRIPAAFCGTVGHKPSGGLIPLHGHFPPPLGSSQFLVGGPLCRRVADVMPLLRVMAGPDGHDATCEALPLGDPEKVELRALRILTLPAPLRVSDVMRAAVDASVAALGSQGATVEKLDPELLRGGFAMWMAALTSASAATYDQMLSDGAGISLGSELLRLPFGKSSYVLASLVTVLSERLLQHLPRSLNDMGSHLARLERLRRQLDEALGENGVIIYPPYTRPAPRHHGPLLTPFDVACTAIWNVLGYPATVVPVGFDARGLPVSVQVVARRGLDHVTVAVAAALEKEFGGWRRADPLAAGGRGEVAAAA